MGRRVRAAMRRGGGENPNSTLFPLTRDVNPFWAWYDARLIRGLELANPELTCSRLNSHDDGVGSPKACTSVH